MPAHCTITKGCAGTLYKVGETATREQTAPVEGLTDWFPRGQVSTSSPSFAVSPQASLSCSSTGALTLAIFSPGTHVLANPTINVVLKARLSADISSTEYEFIPATSTQIISGKDVNGKNLRFDQTAINEGRLSVVVNGVFRHASSDALGYSATPGVLTFNTPLLAGSIVGVTVFGQAPTETVSLAFTLNNSVINSSSTGAWGNIRWIDEYDKTTGLLKSVVSSHPLWWLYTCNSIESLSAGAQVQLSGIMDTTNTTVLVPGTLGDFSVVRFLLAKPPYDSLDRYLNFYVDGQLLASDFSATSEVTSMVELLVSASSVSDIYPPFQLVSNTNLAASSFVTVDTFSTSDSVSIDSPATVLTASKIIGPV